MEKVILIMLLSICLISFGQEKNEKVDIRNTIVGDLNPYTSGLWIKPATFTKVKGSPYLFDNWDNLATILSSEGLIFKVKNINYDTKSDRFVSKYSLDSIFEFNPNSIIKVRIKDNVFEYIESSNINSYYELIADAKGKQILKKSTKILKEGIRDPFTNSVSPSRYILKEKYYFKSNEIALIEIKLKNKPFSKLFKDESQLIKKIISKNKLNLKKDLDLKSLFNIYKQTSLQNI